MSEKKIHTINERSTVSMGKCLFLNIILIIVTSLRPGYPLNMLYTYVSPHIVNIVSEAQTLITEEIAEGRAAATDIDTPLDDEIHADSYAYNTLSYDEKVVYLEIYDALTSFSESITVSTLSEELLNEAYDAVIADHGEFYWSSGYSCRTHTRKSGVVQLDFVPLYTMDESTRDYFARKIDTAVTRILSDAPIDGNDYEKAKFVFDYLASNIEYSRTSDENQNILSVFLYHESVCQGYAAATQYLLRELGVQSTIVTGLANNEPHAWNLVLLDGEYYYIDTTWGNSSFTGESVRFIDYSYFAVTSAENDLTHRATVSFPLPNCRATSNNYYMQEQLFFSSFDTDAIVDTCKEGLEQDGIISLKYASADLYRKAVDYLIQQGNVAKICEGNVFYMGNEDLYTLTLKAE